MSQWTHVAGVIRYDDMRRVLLASSQPIELPDPPTGSEGPLTVTFRDGANDHQAYDYMTTATVVGDLRDFGESDVPEIEAWFQTAVTALAAGVGVRDAVLLINVESGPRFVLTHTSAGVQKSELPA